MNAKLNLQRRNFKNAKGNEKRIFLKDKTNSFFDTVFQTNDKWSLETVCCNIYNITNLTFTKTPITSFGFPSIFCKIYRMFNEQ